MPAAQNTPVSVMIITSTDDTKVVYHGEVSNACELKQGEPQGNRHLQHGVRKQNQWAHGALRRR